MKGEKKKATERRKKKKRGREMGKRGKIMTGEEDGK